ncbi:MAG TPA: TIGR00282 family metallophosphoesterase [Dehalococcoidia bacterium]|nr:TIGR00282 family metallophosphoesterase [Dehalococcoidia bacterium]
MRLLMVGDVVGRPGRRALGLVLPQLRREYGLDLVIVNGENVAGGQGLTPETAEELFALGVDVITSGNHIWEHKELYPYLGGQRPVLRPLNYPPQAPGRGYIILEKAMVVNLVGRVFMGNFDCPFRGIDQLLAQERDRPPVVIVDFHAEATSEKNAMGWYLDGRVSAVLGTHTHVGTIDWRVLPRGTAYVTDIGMTGPMDSVIGVEVEAVLQRFLTLLPHRLPVGKGRVVFNAVLVDIDEASGRARKIDRLVREVGDEG